MTLITTNNLLRFDAAIWIIFGILWIFFPTCLLSMNTVNMKYDSVHIHMTRAFGLFIIYTGIVSYCTSYTDENQMNRTMQLRLTFSLILLAIMIYDNYHSKLWNMKHVHFGMTGLILSMLVPILVLNLHLIN
jgi:hypothetical protein